MSEDWALRTLRKVVQLVGAPELGHPVVEELEHVARSRPAIGVEILAAMLERPLHEWDPVGWRSSVESILRIAVESDAPAARQGVRDIVDRYLRGLPKVSSLLARFRRISDRSQKGEVHNGLLGSPPLHSNSSPAVHILPKQS